MNPTPPSCPVDDGLPGCGTGLAGRLGWVVREVLGIVRARSHPAQAPPADGGGEDDSA